MKPTQSIKFRLAASLWILFAVIAGVGTFGLNRLNDFNRESSDVRDRWLKNTRYLGDLNNYTSDFRAAEGAFLIAPRELDVVSIRREMESLDEAISVARRRYETIAHDDLEIGDYKLFKKKWGEYRAEAKRTLEAMTSGKKAEAINLFMSPSRDAFAVASEALEKLSERNNLQAQQAGDRADEAIREARLLIVVAVTSGVSMALAILLYVSRQVTSPLLDLADCMRRLSQNETEVEIRNIDRADELGEMARAVVVFRNNAIELRVNQLALASEASMLEEKLAHERRLSENQRNFVSMVSHEFRTPMTVIDGHAQRLINSYQLSEDAALIERAKKIRTAVKRMNVMINGLLQSSRLMEKDPSLYFHPCDFDMRALLKEVCKLHKEISPNSSLIEEFVNEALPFHGDKNLLFQAFSNLIANAIKYSPAGNAIFVVARARGGGVSVFVKDSGIGIPQEDISKLFARYYRGSNVSSIIGTGIGLYLVKIVVELHGGAIRVKSREGRGSLFVVFLPFKVVNGRA